MREKNSPKFIAILLVIITAFIISGCTTPSFLSFLKKAEDLGSNDDASKYVRGLENIPAFPDSVFMYEKYSETPEVQKMLLQKKSAYLLKNGKKFEDSVVFYKAALQQSGWQFNSEIKREEISKKPGLYWIKGDQGLRIYTQKNDIWYEIISAEDAKTGLSALLARENEDYVSRYNFIELSNVAQFSWDFKYPDVWDVKQTNSLYSNGLDLQFKYKLGGSEVLFQDLGVNFAKSYEEIPAIYLGQLNKNKKPEEKYLLIDDPKHTASIESTEEADGLQPGSGDVAGDNSAVQDSTESTVASRNNIEVGGVKALEILIAQIGKSRISQVLFIMHPKSNRYFAINNIAGDTEFYEYLKLNAKVK